ncbi:MAG: AraC family transcriptional regulator [Bacteroides sp.]|nr:AraC family transcriptional regulator [Bacteroides sp.]
MNIFVVSVLRMRLACCKMLTGGGITVAIGEVAFACGFASLSSFDKSFRKKFGISPTEYMKKCGIMLDGEAAESPR